jgi:hypothetical protein
MPPHNTGQKHKNRNKNHGPSPEQKGYSTSEAIIALKDELVDEAKANREQENRPDAAHKRIEIATLVFVILTTIGVFIQALVLHSSDVTFKNTLDLQRVSSERQLRAYVGVLPGELQNLGDRTKQQFTLVRKNYGLTPAYDLFVVSFGQAVIRIGEPIPSGGPAPADIRGTITLFPSAELAFNHRGIMVAEDQIARVMQGDDIQMVYFGTVQYRDAFERRHFTHFCWMFTRKHTSAKEADACLGYNDSD